jgi:hypothetical protein
MEFFYVCDGALRMVGDTISTALDHAFLAGQRRGFGGHAGHTEPPIFCTPVGHLADVGDMFLIESGEILQTHQHLIRITFIIIAVSGEVADVGNRRLAEEGFPQVDASGDGIQVGGEDHLHHPYHQCHVGQDEHSWGSLHYQVNEDI